LSTTSIFFVMILRRDGIDAIYELPPVRLKGNLDLHHFLFE